MTLDEFKNELKRENPSDLTWKYLLQSEIPSFPTEQDYADFQRLVSHTLGGRVAVLVAGSGNWRFSLNPENDFSEFNADSDIDVVVISNSHFLHSWAHIRSYHRKHWAAMSDKQRASLLRRGEDIYSGFVTPKWIPKSPERLSQVRYAHEAILNGLSNAAPGRRTVNMLFFRNESEVHDYYLRGFSLARRKVSVR